MTNDPARLARDMDYAEEIPEADAELLHPMVSMIVIILTALVGGTILGFLAFLWSLIW